MLIEVDMDCTFVLDGGPSRFLKAGQTKKVAVVLGKHLITAASIDEKDRWKTVVQLNKPTQRVVLIELGKVRAARVSAEREVEQLQQQIQARQHEAQQIREAAQAATSTEAAEHFARASLFYDEQLWDHATLELRDDLRLRPGDAYAHALLAKALNWKGDRAGALEHARVAVRQRPGDAYMHEILSQQLAASGDHNGELAEARAAVQCGPDEAHAHATLASALFGNGDVEGSIAEAEKAVHLDEKDPLGYNILSVAYLQKGLPQAASQACFKSAELYEGLRDRCEQMAKDHSLPVPSRNPTRQPAWNNP